MLRTKSISFKRIVSRFLVLTQLLSILCTGVLWSIPAYAMENEMYHTSELTDVDLSKTNDMDTVNSLIIVQDGESKAVIVVPEDRDENIRFAADQLAEYIKKSTRAILEVRTRAELNTEDNQYEDMVRIYVGFTGPGSDPGIQTSLKEIDDEGFIIRPHGNSITIVGPTSWGTRFGVNDFLERYLGVRWLMPGADGEDVPQHGSIAVPRKDNIREEPAFMMRVFSPLNSPNSITGAVQYDWASNNRLHSRIKFHHNIYSLFPSEEYGETHPEIYPIRNGVRYIPPKGVTSGWQPRFTEPETVRIAVDRIIKYFDENPEETSFSLGVNDSGGYCQLEFESTDKINSVGKKDMSDIYYKWVNDVVNGVREKYPDKWFGLLAYDYVADPPSFNLDSHIVPFITKDRMTWVDTEVEAIGKEQIERWKKVSENIGWYDYIYGLTYTLPRVYPHLTGDNYKYAKENGVSAHYAELYPNWGEGPKPWISSKLLWNPYQDVDALMDEWCERAVGIEAAPYLSQYYNHWEKFWTERVKSSTWFDEFKNTTYLEFGTAGYLDLVTAEDMEYSRQLLESVIQKAVTDKEKARASMIFNMFEYYEASSLSYPKKIEPITDSETALAILEDGVINKQLEMASKRLSLIGELVNYPSLRLLTTDPRTLGLEWSGWNPKQLFEIVRYINENEKEGGPVKNRLNFLAKNSEDMKIREFAKLILSTEVGDNFINYNPSYEDNGLKWSPWIVKRGTITKTQELSRTGQSSLKIDSLDRGGPYQDIPVNPGLMAIRSYYYTPEITSGNPYIQLTVTLKDESKLKDLQVIRFERKALEGTVGEWAELDALLDIPDAVGGIPVKHARVVILINGLEIGDAMYLDDAYVYQIPKLSPVSSSNFWNYYDKIKQKVSGYESVYEVVYQQAYTGNSENERNYAKLLLGIINGDIKQALNNNSFEDYITNPKIPAQWLIWSAPGASVERSELNSLTGNASVRTYNLYRGGIIQSLSIKPGLTAIRSYYYTENPSTQTMGYVRIEIQYLDENGAGLVTLFGSLKRVADTPGKWNYADMFVDIPEVYNGKSVKSVKVSVTTNLMTGEEVYLDNIELYQLKQ